MIDGPRCAAGCKRPVKIEGEYCAHCNVKAVNMDRLRPTIRPERELGDWIVLLFILAGGAVIGAAAYLLKR